MTSPERLALLENMKAEFYDDKTNDERRVELLLQVQEWAAEEMPKSKCRDCKKPGVYIPWQYALVEGHCYSHNGMTDYITITGVCEYCFDKMCATGDPDDDSIPAVGPR
jgi:hypothetical protein